MTPELPLAAPAEPLAQLIGLLPVDYVHVRRGRRGPLCSYTLSLACALLEDALARGYTIDRTNGDGPLEEWDGWLIVETPERPTFLEIRRPPEPI